MIAELGLFALILGMMLSLVGVLAPFVAMNQKWAHFQQVIRPVVLLQWFFVTLSFFILMFCFAQDDFTLSYIANNANTTLPLVYKLCALWGAHEGSLLLWAFILSLWTVGVSVYVKHLPNNFASTVIAVLLSIHVGFLLLLIHTSNPFTRLLPFSPLEGADLNPLLQDPGFVIHPPFLYMGYVGLAVPFAFAIARLIHKESDVDFAKVARPFALLAWSFLTVGITLGSWWAYYELGWGGWWFWDPVENASFMPWVCATALVHALYLTQKRKSFQSFALLLALIAFTLSLIGTFLVRSGVISSVHAFASDPLRGMFILGFLSMVVIGAFGLYIKRGTSFNLPQAHLLSKDSLLVLGNMLLLVATLTILLGTLYPIISDVLMDNKLSVGPPYFNSVFTPLALLCIGVMSIAPHLTWYQDKVVKLGVALGVFLLCIVLGYGMNQIFAVDFSILATLGIALATLLLLSTFAMAYKHKKQLLSHFPMLFAHAGVGILVLGIALTTTLETEKELTLKVGQSTVVKEYGFIFSKLEDIQGPNYEGVRATFEIKEHNHLRHVAYPEKRYFIPRNLPMTETAIIPGLFQDFYLALGERQDDGSWTVRLYLKPFVRFIWLGGLLIALGGLLGAINGFKQLWRDKS